MDLELLKSEVTKIIDNIKNHGIFNKENSPIKSFVTNDNTINTYRFYAHEK